MSAVDERAMRIRDTMGTPGWRDIEAMLNEQAKEPLDELYEIMVHKTGTVTGAGAHMRAGKAKGLIAFKESLLDEVKKANQSQPARAD